MYNDTLTRSSPSATASNNHMSPLEDLAADVDESPDEASSVVRPPTTFSKADLRVLLRRESLLTRQLHSETEHTDDDDETSPRPPRALSTQSTWSNPSVASTAELTSDDGHSEASPATSPPLPPTAVKSIIPISEKPLAKEPQIVEQEEKQPNARSEHSVEAGLGRKRCISFACGKKDTKQTISETAPSPPKQIPDGRSASPPKRKCTLKFVCPTRAGVEARVPADNSVGVRRPVSPPPSQMRASARSTTPKVHRGSDSTVTHASPSRTRKSPPVVLPVSIPTAPEENIASSRKISDDSDSSTEATRFHEFASSDDEPEEWVQESTCHRSRLTVGDTLQKENIIRRACEEVEEEVVEEEEEEEADEDDLDCDENDVEDEDDQDGLENLIEDVSDDGFRTDDEEGFAESDSEGEDSDEDWWRPGGQSTAATSVDHVDRSIWTKRSEAASPLSVGSASSSHSVQISPRAVRAKIHRKHSKSAVPISAPSAPVDLPDSTDFVCGTLDEDRPLEQAYLNHLKQKEAAKHKARPQDIDPTFPTSDPEMDEEEDQDLENSESERENFIHGDLEELDGDLTARRRLSPRTRSPAPQLPRHRSPTRRARSPAPGQLKRVPTARSPAPARRSTARSPPPRKLFGHSPRRARSPAPVNRISSPPNTRRVSPAAAKDFEKSADVLASRPELTHTASLPRGVFMLGKPSTLRVDDSDGCDTVVHNPRRNIPKRGAIDIVKGLEKKRQRRKEKLYQKACAKAAAKGDKAYKVKPGKGAERMREVGLELQKYHGKGAHILSM